MEPTSQTFSQLPNEPQYTIHVVSQKTGIPPVTIRAWERRYSLLAPQRGENRYRLYSEQDIAILDWIRNRIAQGLSISKAVNSLNKRLQEGGELEAPPAQQPAANLKQARPPAFYAEQLKNALIAHNYFDADRLLQEVNGVFDLLTIFEGVILPCMVAIGNAWVQQGLLISTEHMATNFIKGKLMTLLNSFPNRRNEPLILLGCPPFEHHELGLLMIAVLLKRSGYQIEYLGVDIPIDDLLLFIKEEKVAMVILSATLEENGLGLAGFQNKLNKLKNPPVFGYGGACFNFNPDLRKKVDGVFLGEGLDQVIERVDSLLR